MVSYWQPNSNFWGWGEGGACGLHPYVLVKRDADAMLVGDGHSATVMQHGGHATRQ